MPHSINIKRLSTEACKFKKKINVKTKVSKKKKFQKRRSHFKVELDVFRQDLKLHISYNNKRRDSRRFFCTCLHDQNM